MSSESIKKSWKISSELQAIIDSIPAYVFVKDLENCFLRSNRAFAESLGQDVREIPGKSAFDLLPRDVAERHREDDREVISSGEPKLGVEEPGHREGGPGWFSTDRVPYLSEEGEIIGVVCVSMDITARKSAEEALSDSEERLQGFYDATIEGIAVIEHGRLVDVNRRFSEIFGYDRAELIGREVSALVDEKDKDLVAEKISTGYDRPYQLKARRKDGSVVFIEVHGRATQLSGRPVRVSTITDMTDRRRLQEQLLHAQKMESIGLLAGGIAHDFNNILTPIMASVGYMQLQLPRESHLHEDLKEITRAAERARELVKQVLAFSRREKATREPVCLRALIREDLKLLRSTIPSTIEIRDRICSSCGQVVADAGQIHQVILNLCTNAHQAMGDRGGVLSVALEPYAPAGQDNDDDPALPEGKYAVITIGDTGSGMDGETKKRIFEPYFTTKGSGEGSGLGLAVVHGIVKSHGGHITVRSEPGEGTLFSVYLPVSDGERPIASKRDTEIPRGNERILFIDDEDTVVSTTKRVLTSLGYKVTTYTNSRRALERFRKAPEKFDLVITDQTIPEMTGAELAREVLEIRPDLPVIICTGFSRSINPEIAADIGARALLFKPVTVETLATEVRKALDRPVSRNN